jgi:putative addiction module component (TIGR02574 family)
MGLQKKLMPVKFEAMSATEILESIRRLPEAQRRELVERIEDEFIAVDDRLTPEQIAEFERRAEELRRHPERGIPWETVQAELPERLKSRKA